MHYLEISGAETIAAAKYQIELWLLRHNTLWLYKDGALLAEFPRDRCSFTPAFGKLVFSFWNAARAGSYRVNSCRITDTALVLKVAGRFGQGEHSLWLSAAAQLLPDRATVRRVFLTRIMTSIKMRWPRLRLLRAGIGSNHREGWQADVARMLWRDDRGLIAAVGINLISGRRDTAALLAQGLAWMLRLQARTPPVDRLRIFTRQGLSDQLAERLTVISAPFAIELYELDEGSGAISLVQPFDQGELAVRLARSTVLLRQRALLAERADVVAQLAEFSALAPHQCEVYERAGTTRMAINGLEVARVQGRLRPRIIFGIDAESVLTADNEPELRVLIEEVARYRRYHSPSRQHRYYRMAGEAWLESIVRRDARALDSELLPDYIYAQVPLFRRDGQRYVDLLGMRQDGRLVVIELKVSESAELPFQGLDYWLRVEWYRQRGELARRGYFPGRQIKDEPALLYLVAPRLRFHKSYLALSALIDSRVPVYCIAINDNWRKRLSVQSCQPVNLG